MNAVLAAQKRARRYNEDEAVWRCYPKKRALRRFCTFSLPLAKEVLDDLDWRAAERECRKTRAIGFSYP